MMSFAAGYTFSTVCVRAKALSRSSSLGSIVVRLMLDYRTLPFLSSQNPYLEWFGLTAAPPSESAPGRDVEFVVYGWTGAPIYESTTMSASVATTTLEAIFGDFGQYIIVDRVGVSMIYEPLVKGTGGILPGGQAGWFMFWRVGGNLSTVNGFRVMKGA